jgi:DNA-binding NtrC family response regulator
MKKDRTILIIDDDRFMSASLTDFLSGKQYRVLSAESGRSGIEVFSNHHPAIVLLDQELPDISGLSVCRRLLDIDPVAKIIFITAHATVRTAVDAMQAGAFNYLAKPFSLDELLITIDLAEKNVRLEEQLKVREYENAQARRSSQLIGSSAVMQRLRDQTQLLASTDSAVLITGETGVGKNLVATVILEQQKRRETLLTINCSAIPENLVEAEYFGHEKGAFTGADTRREGIFELASGGTLVLDEIADVPFHLQSKLLSVIEDRQIRRIGSARMIPVDVRIIATTNRDLRAAIRENRFREDLYYRLAVVNLHIPPLRQHPEDIPQIALYFAQRFSNHPAAIPSTHLNRLKQYRWPGNIRELRNVIERATLLKQGEEIRPADFLFHDQFSGEKPPEPCPRQVSGQDQPIPLDDLIADHIRTALKKCAGNKSQAARRLGISLSTLKRRLKRVVGPDMGQNEPPGHIDLSRMGKFRADKLDVGRLSENT